MSTHLLSPNRSLLSTQRVGTLLGIDDILANMKPPTSHGMYVLGES